MAEFAPGADAHAGCIPAKAGAVGGFRQPEIAMVEHVEQVVAVEDCGVFPGVMPVIAANPDIGITR